ncbi:spore germination protein [Bacillus sp. FJAT-47783]|uniref:spore germination protein n=1 Tax=Bacillus sp. FJAT-47783 TaxID=2922712 RepID=UPI001FADDF23|nr:spore germination protein [Bacillus sp. FJAT-47783]
MPAFVGAIELESVGDGAFKVGDTFSISPKSSLKSALGSGALNTGDRMRTVNIRNVSNEFNPNVSDQTQAFNN